MADPRDKVILQTGTKLFGSVDYELFSDGYTENYVEGNPSITLRARTRWGRSYEFIANMLGTAGTDLTRDSGMSRQTPVGFPDTNYEPAIYSQGDLNVPFLGWWCTSARMTATHGELTCQDQTTGALVPPIRPDHALESGTDYNPTTGELLDNGYDVYNRPVQTGVGMAEYELTYEPLQYEIRTDAEMDTLDAPLNACELSRYVVRRYRFQGNAFTLQPGSLYWRDRLIAGPADRADARIDSSAVRPFPSAELTYVWLNVPGIPWDAIEDAIGRVNASETGAAAPSGQFDYRPDWQGISVPGGTINGFMPGTLLFQGVTDITPKTTAAGQLLYDISYSMLWRPDGHTKIYRAADDSFQRVVRVSTKNDIQANWKDLLDEYTFSNLFKL